MNKKLFIVFVFFVILASLSFVSASWQYEETFSDSQRYKDKHSLCLDGGKCGATPYHCEGWTGAEKYPRFYFHENLIFHYSEIMYKIDMQKNFSDCKLSVEVDYTGTSQKKEDFKYKIQNSAESQDYFYVADMGNKENYHTIELYELPQTLAFTTGDNFIHFKSPEFCKTIWQRQKYGVTYNSVGLKSIKIQCGFEEEPECTEGETKQCGVSNIGECRYGEETCIEGEWRSCIGAVFPSIEICDGKDNDCNGLIDEGNVCANITCSINSDCGQNRAIGNPYCSQNYTQALQDYIAFTCHNPGQVNSYCTNSTTTLSENCAFGCENGECVDDERECSDGIDNDGDSLIDWPADPECECPQDDDEANGYVTCYNNSQCGINFESIHFCIGKSIYKNYTTFTCHNPNTVNSYCTNSTELIFLENCSEVCENGQCIEEEEKEHKESASTKHEEDEEEEEEAKKFFDEYDEYTILQQNIPRLGNFSMPIISLGEKAEEEAGESLGSRISREIQEHPWLFWFAVIVILVFLIVIIITIIGR